MGVLRWLLVLLTLAACVACGSRPKAAPESQSLSVGAQPGDHVETRTVVEKTPTGTRTVTVTTTTRTVDPPPPPERPADPYPSDPLVKFNVDQLNAYRARAHLAPLRYDARISAFALEGSRELAKSHVAHAHFVRAAQGSGVFGPRSAENQGDPNGAPAMGSTRLASGKAQILLLLKLMFDEGPGGGHYDNMMNPKYRRVGIGLHDVGGRLYLTNDFSD